jgi:hypothetical protein
VTTCIRPGQGTRAEQIDALDRAMLENASQIRAMQAEIRKLREQLTATLIVLGAHKAVLESWGRPVPEPLVPGERDLHLVTPS